MQLTDRLMRSWPLVICCLFPVAFLRLRGATLVSSTYFGGPLNDDAYAVAVDKEGNIYFTGSTGNATAFPLTNAVQEVHAGQRDAYICKMSSAGQILFSTYFGGSGDEESNGIVIDSNGDI